MTRRALVFIDDPKADISKREKKACEEFYGKGFQDDLDFAIVYFSGMSGLFAFIKEPQPTEVPLGDGQSIYLFHHA